MAWGNTHAIRERDCEVRFSVIGLKLSWALICCPTGWLLEDAPLALVALGQCCDSSTTDKGKVEWTSKTDQSLCLTLMDVFLWGHPKAHIYTAPPRTIEDLVAESKQLWPL